MSLICLVVALSFSATATRGANILFVSSMGADDMPTDDLIKAFMEGLGHTVTYIDDDDDEATTEAAAIAADLVLISETTSSSKIRDEITEIETPMIVFEPSAWDEMGLTEGGGGNDPVVTTDVDVVDPGHYLAAGLSGTVAVLTDITSALGVCELGQGIAGPEGTVIATATLVDGVTYDVIFVYEKGAALAVAPADGSPQVAADIRIGFGFQSNCYPVLSENAYLLLGAAVDYALGMTGPAGVTIPVEAGGDIAAANAAAVAGDTIEIAAGTFTITAAIEIKDGVTYQGAGADLTVIDGGGVTRAFFGWGDRGATSGQVDANGDGVPNLTGPKGWVLDGLTIQNCVTGADNRQDILGAARDLLNNYTGAPYTLATAQAENGGITDNPGWFDVLSGGADDNLTDAELQAYLDANPPGSAGHLVVNDDKRDDGGAVCILNGAEGTIRNCTFSNNTADGHGGAINVDGVALVVAIEDCAFDLNTSGGDAAVNLTSADSNFTVTGCSFTECTAGDDAGALSMESGERTIYTVTDCMFTGNYCADDGGAIKADGDDSTNVWTNCTFIGNTAGDDGAAVRYSPDRAELTMTNCTFIGNGKDADGTVVGDDGVWQCKDDDAGSVTFENCLFADNACNDDRLIELKAAFAILNCTFINNVAGDKALIAVRGAPWDSTGDGVDDVTTDDSIISNCLFINNTMLSDSNVIGDTRDNIFAPTVTNCLFFGNLDGSNPANNTNNDSTEVGTIDVSAVTDAAQLVVNPAPGGDYHLAAGSAAIDASDPATATATDIEGTAAVGVRDVGAYEWSDQIWLEAEAADPMGTSWLVVDDPTASGGIRIGSDDGVGNDNDIAPGAEWFATYSFTAAGGDYKVVLRGQEAGSDSFWVRIVGATSQTLEDPDQPGTGWVRFNGFDAPSGWAWDEVHSDDHDRQIVNWTLPAGANTLEIAKREDGVYLDAILITNDLGLDQTILDGVPQP